MAQAKKTTTKKPASTTRAKATTTTRKTAAAKTTRKPAVKSAPAKKTVAKKPVARKTTAPRKKTTKAASAPKMRSFHVSQNNPPFTSFQVTRQTLYWVILVSFIVFAQLWIISLQVEVAALLEAQQVQLLDMQ